MSRVWRDESWPAYLVYVNTNQRPCRYCRVPIVFGKTTKGHGIPLTAAKWMQGEIEPHKATCPEFAGKRRPRKHENQESLF